jgi:putative tryptophan/tyrosine transport system substrate-binding protein
MRRRDFFTVVGSAVAWPLTARAQEPAIPVVGFLSSRAPVESELEVAEFRRGLAQAGYSEHQNVTVEYRWAENQYERLPALAADLATRQVRVIAALEALLALLRSSRQQKPFHSFSSPGSTPSNLVSLIVLPNLEATRPG